MFLPQAFGSYWLGGMVQIKPADDTGVMTSKMDKLWRDAQQVVRQGVSHGRSRRDSDRAANHLIRGKQFRTWSSYEGNGGLKADGFENDLKW